jgi:hypothetical protein
MCANAGLNVAVPPAAHESCAVLARVETLRFASALAGACGGLDAVCARRRLAFTAGWSDVWREYGDHASATYALRDGAVNARRPRGTRGRSRSKSKAERVDGAALSAKISRVIAAQCAADLAATSRARRRTEAAQFALAMTAVTAANESVSDPLIFARGR